MRYLNVVLAVIIALLAGTVGISVADSVDDFDRDELCASEYGPGWEHADGPSDDVTYCEAPNGTLHETVVHLGGPVFPVPDTLFMLLMGSLIIFILGALSIPEAETDSPHGG